MWTTENRERHWETDLPTPMDASAECYTAEVRKMIEAANDRIAAVDRQRSEVDRRRKEVRGLDPLEVDPEQFAAAHRELKFAEGRAIKAEMELRAELGELYGRAMADLESYRAGIDAGLEPERLAAKDKLRKSGFAAFVDWQPTDYEVGHRHQLAVNAVVNSYTTVAALLRKQGEAEDYFRNLRTARTVNNAAIQAVRRQVESIRKELAAA